MTEPMKRCPFCDELVRAGATKCKHCGSTLNGFHESSRSPPMPGLAAGAMVREYQVLRLLGEGGMGQVYQAQHTYTRQIVALKTVHQHLMSDVRARSRFLEEGRMMGSLQHPNIVSLLNFFEESELFFLVMEFVHGPSLEQMLQIQAAGLPLERAVRIGEGLLSGLAFAHGQQPPIIHRDVKPANILLTPDDIPKLSDFGIAKPLDTDRARMTSGPIGTYEYMSPEQGRGEAGSPAMDVYSSGVVLYRLLVGSVPFPQKTDTGIDVMMAHCSTPPPPVQGLRPDCPDRLAQVIHQALEKDPAMRFSDCRELLAAWSDAAAVSGLGRGRTHSTRGEDVEPAWFQPAVLDSWPTTEVLEPGMGYSLRVPSGWLAHRTLDRRDPSDIREHFLGTSPEELLSIRFFPDSDLDLELKTRVEAPLALQGFPSEVIRHRTRNLVKLTGIEDLGAHRCLNDRLGTEENRLYTGEAYVPWPAPGGVSVNSIRFYIFLGRRKASSWQIWLSFLTASCSGRDSDQARAMDDRRAGATFGHLTLGPPSKGIDTVF